MGKDLILFGEDWKWRERRILERHRALAEGAEIGFGQGFGCRIGDGFWSGLKAGQALDFGRGFGRQRVWGSLMLLFSVAFFGWLWKVGLEVGELLLDEQDEFLY